MMIRIFRDSSALSAAILSTKGAARELVRLAIKEEFVLVVSVDMIVETRRNINSKAPELMPLVDHLLEIIDPEIVQSPSKKAVRKVED